ncbi:MAG: hypothetical protein PSW75_03245 [bacterium]|nr:hypothetical protein [bacterium]
MERQILKIHLIWFAVWYNGRKRCRQALTPGMIDAGLGKTLTPKAIWAYAEARGMLREFNLEAARIHVLKHKTASVTDAGIRYEALNYTVPDFDPKSPGGIEANDWLAKAKFNRWEVDLSIDSAAVGHTCHVRPKRR